MAEVSGILSIPLIVSNLRKFTEKLNKVLSLFTYFGQLTINQAELIIACDSSAIVSKLGF